MMSSDEELLTLYLSPNIVRVIKSRRLRWEGHVARMEEGGSVFEILTGTPAGKRPLGRLWNSFSACALVSLRYKQIRHTFL